jgi:hypothetical protein
LTEAFGARGCAAKRPGRATGLSTLLLLGCCLLLSSCLSAPPTDAPAGPSRQSDSQLEEEEAMPALEAFNE